MPPFGALPYLLQASYRRLAADEGRLEIGRLREPLLADRVGVVGVGIGLDAVYQALECPARVAPGLVEEALTVGAMAGESGAPVSAEVERLDQNAGCLVGQRIRREPALRQGGGFAPVPLLHARADKCGERPLVLADELGADGCEPFGEARRIADGESGHESGNVETDGRRRVFGGSALELRDVAPEGLGETDR